MKKYVIFAGIIVVLFSFFVTGYAQSEKVFSTFDDKITVRLSYTIMECPVTIEPKGVDEEPLSDPKKEMAMYEPNVDYTFGISLTYKDYGFSYHTVIPYINKKFDETLDEYGDTKYDDILLRYMGRKLFVEAFFMRYKGYFLSNPYDFQDYLPDQIVLRPDIGVISYGVNLYYILNHENFSFKAAVDQSERQDKCGGTFFVFNSLTRNTVDSDYSLIPASQEVYFEEYQGIEDLDLISFRLAPGGAYTLTLWDFYGTISGYFGGSINRYDIKGLEKKFTGYDFTYCIGFKMGLGYNGDRFMAGTTFSWDSMDLEKGSFLFSTNLMYFEYFAGFRI